ncbi:hypothetical protein LSAT2_021497, partial [Lamellibrachia satsuma]
MATDYEMNSRERFVPGSWRGADSPATALNPIALARGTTTTARHGGAGDQDSHGYDSKSRSLLGTVEQNNCTHTDFAASRLTMWGPGAHVLWGRTECVKKKIETRGIDYGGNPWEFMQLVHRTGSVHSIEFHPDPMSTVT